MKNILLTRQWEVLFVGLFILGCVGCGGGKGVTTEASFGENRVLLSRAKKDKRAKKDRRGKKKQGDPNEPTQPPLPPDQVPPGYQFPVPSPPQHQKMPTQRFANADVQPFSPGMLLINGQKYVSNEIIVKFFEDTPDATINNLIGRDGGQIVRQILYSQYRHWYVVGFPDGAKLWEIVDVFNDDPSVEYASLNGVGQAGAG